MTVMETKVAEIIKDKGATVYTIQRSASAYEAVELMTRKGVGSLVVLDGEQICGIVTERDFIRKVVLKNSTADSTPVGEIMTKQIVCAAPEDTVEQCMATMTEQRFRHLPVVERGELAGIVSIGDLIKRVTHIQETHIRYLTDYITGKYPA